MSLGAPYRAGCAGYQTCTFGPPFQHRDPKRTAVTVYSNATTLNGDALDYLHTTTANEVTCPDGTTRCAGDVTPPGTYYDGTNYGTANLIGPWFNPHNTASPQFPEQTFTTAGTKDLSSCNLTGWKQVWAHLYWYGVPAYDDYDARQVASLLCGTPDWGYSLPSWSYKPVYHETPAQVRYTTQTGAVSMTRAISQTACDGTISTQSTGYTYDWSWSIDTDTGLVSGSASASQTGDTGESAVFSLAEFMAFVADLNGLDASKSIYDIQDGGTNWFYTYMSGLYGQADGGECSSGCTCALNVLSGSVALAATGTELKVQFEIQFVRTCACGDGYPAGTNSTYTETFTVDATIQLGGASNATDVVAACEGLLASWNLADNNLYPPINQPYTGIVPLMEKHQAAATLQFPSMLNPDFGSGDSWSATYTDPNAGYYTGATLGAPCGYELDLTTGFGYFDPYAIGWQDCCGCDSILSGGWLAKTYGQWSGNAGATLPNQATHWTTNYDATLNQLPIGRHRLTSVQGGIWVSKYAETKIRFPSIDHSRPNGNDNGLVDETCVGCVSSFSGGTFNLSNNITVSVGDLFAYINGDGSIYRATSGGTMVSSFAATATGDTWNSAGYPSGYNDSSAVIAKLRFPSCPPMAGRLAISSVADNGDGTVTVTFAESPVAIATPWTVDLCAANMSALASGLTVASGSTTTTVKVTASYSAVSGAKWLVIHGALDGETVSGVAKWYEQDSTGKGNFTLLEWTADLRSPAICGLGLTDCSGSPLTPPACGLGWSAFSATDECAEWITCAPWLIVLSPNEADTPPSGQGVRYDFSGSFTADMVYGSKQSLMVAQAMVDPLHQSPHSLCDGSPRPSSCVPLVEARAYLPGHGGATTPPDNGFGTSQNQGPSIYPVDYTALSPVSNDSSLPFVYVAPIATCSQTTQPVSQTVPTGVFAGC